MNSAEITTPTDTLRPLDVRLLGVVRVRADNGTPIDIGGPKPKTVLVRLALQAGQIVTTNSLVDTLWGEDPPRTARRSLQAHVAKLRAALGGAEGPLTSSGVGYVLDVPRESVDVLRIEDRLTSARELMTADAALARTLLAECRSEWSGQPFADLGDDLALFTQRKQLLRLKDELDDAELELELATGDPSRVVLELERSVSNDPTHEPHWMRLITAYYSAGRQSDALDAYRRATNVLLEHLGVDPSPKLRLLEGRILRQEMDALADVETCPYKGLVSYQIADGRSFHGRSDVTDALVNLVTGAPFSVVIGQSGVGKSSVLRAGLAHRVIEGQVAGVRTVALITPGVRPLRSLYAAPGQLDLLVVDQFEELFTLTDDVERRDEFVHELADRAADGQTRVVISVRADFYAHCLGLNGLSGVLARHQVNIGPMSEIGLREAIAGPATQAGLEIEPDLLETVISEVGNRPGALPLLSHALSETWRHRSQSTLTLEAYRDAGSIAGAISATAERLHASLDPESQGDLKRLFRRLVEPGSGTEHTRRAVDLSELTDAHFDQTLIDRLVDTRLLTASHNQVEIAHEALISAWPRLGEWIDTEHDNIAQHQRLTRAAAAWFESSRDDADLLRGSKLSSALTWRQDSNPTLTIRETEFLDASDSYAQNELASARRTNRRLRSLVGVTAVAMVAALVAGGIAIGRSRDADRRNDQLEVNQAASVLFADETLSQSDRLWSAAALHARSPTPGTAGFLLGSILGAPEVTDTEDFAIRGFLGTAPLRASGLIMVVEDEDGQPKIFNSLFGEVEEIDVPFLPAAVVGGPGQVLAVHGETFEVYNLVDGSTFGPAPVLAGKPSMAALSPNGALMALGYNGVDRSGEHAFVEVVDVQDGTVISRIDWESDGFQTIDELELIDGDGAMLLIQLEGFVLGLWDVTSGERIIRTSSEELMAVAGGGVLSTAAEITTTSFNLWGDGVVIGRADGTVELWRNDQVSWRRISRAPHHGGPVTWIEFDWDDELVVSSSSDGSVVLLDAHDGSVQSGPIEFATSGDVVSYFHIETGEVATMDATGKTWRWSAGIGAFATTVPAASGGSPSMDASEWFGVAEERAVAVAGSALRDLELPAGVIDVVTSRSGDYVAVYADRLDWYRPDGAPVLHIDAPSRSLDGRITVDGDTIAFAQPDEIVVMNAAGEVVEQINTATRGGASRIALSNGGRDLIVSNLFGTLIRYSLTSATAEVLLEDGLGFDAHFINDRQIVAVGSAGMQLMELDSDQPPTAIGIGRDATRIALDDDRDFAATMNTDGVVTFWNTRVGEQIGPSFTPLESETPRSFGFSNAGSLIVGGETVSAVVSTDTDVWLSHACALIDELGVDNAQDPRLRQFDDGCA